MNRAEYSNKPIMTLCASPNLLMIILPRNRTTIVPRPLTLSTKPATGKKIFLIPFNLIVNNYSNCKPIIVFDATKSE